MLKASWGGRTATFPNTTKARRGVITKGVQSKQHIFFNAGGKTATEQTELIIEIVEVIANVYKFMHIGISGE